MRDLSMGSSRSGRLLASGYKQQTTGFENAKVKMFVKTRETFRQK